MSIFDSIEKLITEHGSAAILSQQLAFARDQFSDMERKVADLQTQIGHLQAQLARECTDHKQAREDLQRLKDEHAEDIRIHRTIEFRRGKRTGGRWMAFSPKCHLPAAETMSNGEPMLYCFQKYEVCGWRMYPQMTLPQVIMQLEV
jgi:TolA-binding protein